MSSPTQAATDPEPAPADGATGTPGTPGTGVPARFTRRSPRQLAWLRFRRDSTGVVCGGIVAVYILIALFAPVITALYGRNAYTLYGQDDDLLNSYGLPVGPN